jgi:hypothetical protein
MAASWVPENAMVKHLQQARPTCHQKESKIGQKLHEKNHLREISVGPRLGL